MKQPRWSYEEINLELQGVARGEKPGTSETLEMIQYLFARYDELESPRNGLLLELRLVREALGLVKEDDVQAAIDSGNTVLGGM